MDVKSFLKYQYSLLSLALEKEFEASKRILNLSSVVEEMCWD